MGKFLKYDLKSSKRYFRTMLIIHILFLIAAVITIRVLGYTGMRLKSTMKSGLLGLGMAFFMATNIFFIINTISRDLYRPRAILTHSLPLRPKDLLRAKNMAALVTYVFNGVFVFSILKILDVNVDTNTIYYMVLGLVWFMIFANILALTMGMKRYRISKHSWFYGLGAILAILLLAFVVCKYMSFVLVNGNIQKASPMNYAFIYPFAIAKLDHYKNLTPIVYYLLSLLIIFGITVKALGENVDLS